MSNLAPSNCCTDPGNDQNNTNGWSAALGFEGTVLSSVAGGVTGYRLKGDHPYNASAVWTDTFSLIAGVEYNLSAVLYGNVYADNLFVYVGYDNMAHLELQEQYGGLGESIPVTVDTTFTPSTSSNTYRVAFVAGGLGDYNPIYADNVYVGDHKNQITAQPITVTSSVGLQGIYEVHLSSYCYEETTKGIASDLTLKTRDGIGTDILNIFRRKNTKYLWYDADTNGQDLVVSFYVDGTLEDKTLTINTTGRVRDRLDLWNMEGYRFAIKLNAQGVRERGMNIYSPWNIIYDYAGV